MCRDLDAAAAQVVLGDDVRVHYICPLSHHHVPNDYIIWDVYSDHTETGCCHSSRCLGPWLLLELAHEEIRYACQMEAWLSSSPT